MKHFLCIRSAKGGEKKSTFKANTMSIGIKIHMHMKFNLVRSPLGIYPYIYAAAWA